MATETEQLNEEGTPASQTPEGLLMQALIERVRRMSPEKQQQLYASIQTSSQSDEEIWADLGI